MADKRDKMETSSHLLTTLSGWTERQHIQTADNLYIILM